MANRPTSARRRQREELGDTDSSEEVTAVQQAILGDPAINSTSTNSSRPPSRSKSRIGFKALGNMFAGSEKQQEQQSGSGLGLKGSLSRPLTGLFRRSTGSGSREQNQQHKEQAAVGISNGSLINNQAGKDNISRRGSGSAKNSINVPVMDIPAIGDSAISSDSQIVTQQQELSQEAAIAPHISLRHFSSIYQTNEPQYVKSLIKRTGGEIDINFLSRLFYSEQEVLEEQIHWTWDYLLTSVSDEINNEQQQEDSELSILI